MSTKERDEEILVAETVSDVPAIADDRLVAIAEAAEKRIDAINKIKQLALKVTNASDWVEQGGKPYLQVSGAEKVARLFGISWRISEPVFEQTEDGHFSYTYKGYFSFSGATIEAMGTRSSKDGFFSRRRGEDVPPSEIDKGNLKKAAYTNCVGNGITRLLGIRNLTWEDLKAGGIDTANITSIEYKTGGKAPEKPAIKDPNAPATDAQLRKIFTLFGKLGLQDKEEMKDWLAVNMKIRVESSKALTKGQASQIIEELIKRTGS